MHIGRALIVVALLTACAPAGNTGIPEARAPVTLLPTLAPTPVPVATDPVTPIAPGAGNLPSLSRDLIFPRTAQDGARQDVALMRYRHDSGRVETVLEQVFTPEMRAAILEPERPLTLIRLWTSQTRNTAHMIFGESVTLPGFGRALIVSVDIDTGRVIRTLALPRVYPASASRGAGHLARPAQGLGSFNKNGPPYLVSPTGDGLIVFMPQAPSTGARGKGVQRPAEGGGPQQGEIVFLNLNDPNSAFTPIARCADGGTQRGACGSPVWLRDGRRFVYLDRSVLTVAGVNAAPRAVSRDVLALIESPTAQSPSGRWLLVVKAQGNGDSNQFALADLDGDALLSLPVPPGMYVSTPTWTPDNRVLIRWHAGTDGGAQSAAYAITDSGVAETSQYAPAPMTWTQASPDSAEWPYMIGMRCPRKIEGGAFQARCASALLETNAGTGATDVLTPLPNFALPIADGFVWARWLPDAQAVVYGGLSDPVFVDLKTRRLYAADALLPGCACFLGVGSLAR